MPEEDKKNLQGIEVKPELKKMSLENRVSILEQRVSFQERYFNKKISVLVMSLILGFSIIGGIIAFVTIWNYLISANLLTLIKNLSLLISGGK